MRRVPGLLFPNGAAASDSVQGAEAKSSGENDSQTRTREQGDSGRTETAQMKEGVVACREDHGIHQSDAGKQRGM